MHLAPSVSPPPHPQCANMKGDGMSETISIPVNLWLRGLHLGRERSHVGMGQVNDGQAWARVGVGGGEVRRSTPVRCDAVASKADYCSWRRVRDQPPFTHTAPFLIMRTDGG